MQNKIARRESAEQALRPSRSELATLARQLISTQEIERQRIARELHDSIGQQLTAIKLGLECGVELMQQARPHDAREVQQRAIASLQQTMQELRAIIMQLRPLVLDDLGAASAVSWLCREFAQSYPLLSLHQVVAVADADIPEQLGTAVFRSLQDLLNNVVEHARGREVSVMLTRSDGLLVLAVTDDGLGVAASARGMHELRMRAEMSGGRLCVELGAASVGRQVRIEWHLGKAEPRTDGA